MLKTINNMEELKADLKVTLIKGLNMAIEDQIEPEVDLIISKQNNLLKDIEYPLIKFTFNKFEETEGLQKFQWDELTNRIRKHEFECKLDRRKLGKHDYKLYLRSRVETPYKSLDYWNLEFYPRYKFLSASYDSMYQNSDFEFIYLSITSNLIRNDDNCNDMEGLVSQLSLVTKVQDPIFAKLRPYAELHDEDRTVYKYYKYHDGEVSASIRYIMNYGSSLTVSMRVGKDGTKFRMYNDRDELGKPDIDAIMTYIKEHDSCPEDKKWHKFVTYVSIKRRLRELDRYEYNKPDPYYKYYYDIISSMRNCFTMNFDEPNDKVYGHSETEENYFEMDTNKEYHFEPSGRLEALTYWTWTDEKFNLDKLDENILKEGFKVLNETIKSWLRYDYNYIKSITLVPYTTFKLGAQIHCTWDLTEFKDKSYEDMMKLTTTLMLHFRNWIDKFWDNEIVKVFAKACNFDSNKPWEQDFSIDCAPGQVRPGEYFKYICENILKVPYYEPISTFFGCWTWKVTFQNEKQRDDAYEYLAKLTKINAIR